MVILCRTNASGTSASNDKILNPSMVLIYLVRSSGEVSML